MMTSVPQFVFAILCLFLTFPEFFLIWSFFVLVFVGFLVVFTPTDSHLVVSDSVVSTPIVSELVVSTPIVSDSVVSTPIVSELVVSVPVVSELVVSTPIVSELVVSVPVVSFKTLTPSEKLQKFDEKTEFLNSLLPPNLEKDFFVRLFRFRLGEVFTCSQSFDENTKKKFGKLTEELKTFFKIFEEIVYKPFEQSKFDSLNEQCEKNVKLIDDFKKTVEQKEIDKFLVEFNIAFDRIKYLWSNGYKF